jgi:uncharacterized membrane protein YgdD (TMEM256/DUF423 family)
VSVRDVPRPSPSPNLTLPARADAPPGRLFALLGCLSAFVAVAAGAFGAHALRDTLPPDRLDVFETAARYQMYHALALLLVGWLGPSGGRAAAIRPAGWLFVAGTVLFCGSLYVLALSGVRWLGAVTPLGGLAFLSGWLALARAAMVRRDE